MSAGTWESHHAITTLMYHYAECVDAADFDGIPNDIAQLKGLRFVTSTEVEQGKRLAESKVKNLTGLLKAVPQGLIKAAAQKVIADTVAALQKGFAEPGPT